MVGRDVPIAPPTRNEDWPGSCEVKQNMGEKESKSMFCKKCGGQIADAAIVCPKCGTSVTGRSLAPASEKVPNHMVGAILTTLFCCLIGGIVSIVYAAKVNTKLAQGDIEGARAASKTAKTWIIVNMVAIPLIGLLGIFMGALFPAISSSMASAQSSAAAMRGRNLFVGITQACVERESAGLPGVWPRTVGATDLSTDKEDVAGIPFRNSTDYFKTLFDIAAKDGGNWRPYVDVDVGALKLSKDGGFCDWIVAANIQPEFCDVIPVLISANVDPSVLKTSFNGHDDTPIPFGSEVGRTKLPWCDKFVVVIRKDGSSQVLKAKYFTYSNLYNRQSFSAPGLKYLDVE